MDLLKHLRWLVLAVVECNRWISKVGWSVFGFKIMGLIFFFSFLFYQRLYLISGFSFWNGLFQIFLLHMSLLWQKVLRYAHGYFKWVFFCFSVIAKCIFTIFKVSFSIRVVAPVYSLCWTYWCSRVLEEFGASVV